MITEHWILLGLKNMLLLGVLATGIALIFGVILVKGQTANNKYVSIVIRGFIEVIRGLPFILLIFIIYFAIPLSSPVAIAIPPLVAATLSLSLNGACDIANKGIKLIKDNNLSVHIKTIIRVMSILAITELSRMINYLTIIGMSAGILDLIQVTKRIASSTGNVAYYALPVFIYLSIHFITLILQTRLLNRYVTNEQFGKTSIIIE